MSDDAKAWRALLDELAPTLPGEWRVRTRGRSRPPVLVREPVEWTLSWFGMSRPRKTVDPFLMAGVTPLVGHVTSLTSDFGLRSDEVRPRPAYRTVPLTAPEAAEHLRTFFWQDAWPRMEQGTYQAHAERAEAQFAQAPADREPPWVFPEAAGWRVVLGTGSPVEPARQAVETFAAMEGAEDAVACYTGLVEAWESGGPAAALHQLERQRDATLASLALG